jgi:phosphate transport system protein
MSRHLLVEVEKLKKALIHMAGLAEEAVSAAVRSLETRDKQLALSVIDGDSKIDQMEVDVEEECLKILALHQPVAIDLRFIIAVLKINNDLERIADLAVNIAERSAYLATQEPLEIPFALPTMVTKTTSMLRRSLDALVNMDAGQARAVRAMDDDVDAINRQAYTAVQDGIRQDLNLMDRLIHLLSVARHLERIADLASNISEDVIYLVEGVIVRHRPELFEK